MNFFKTDGNIIHFDKPKVSASIASNIFIIQGHAEHKAMTECIPEIIPQLGPDSIQYLQKFIENLQAKQAQSESAAGPDDEEEEEEVKADSEDDEVPQLVENFE